MTNFNVSILGTANVRQMQAQFANLERQVSALNAELAHTAIVANGVNPAGFERMNQIVAQTSRIWRNAAASTGMWETEQIRVTSATDAYTKALEKQKVSFRDLIKNQSVSRAAYREQLKLQNMVVRALPGRTGGKTTLDIGVPTQVSSELDTIGNRIGWIREELKSASTQMVNWGKNTQWAGRQLMVGFTMPVAAFGAATGVLAYQIDKEMTRIQKVYDTTADATSTDAKQMSMVEAELAQVREAGMATAMTAAKQYGAAAQDTLAAQAELAATGLKGAELQQYTNEVMRVSTLGEMEYADALQATISLQSVFRQSADEVADSFNYMNAVENATSLQLKDFATAIPIAAAPVKSFGGDIYELGVLLTAMKERGIDASEGANALKATMQRLSRPSKQIREEFTELTGGMDIVKLVDESESLSDIFTKLGRITANMSDDAKRDIYAGLFGGWQVTRMTALVEGMSDVEKGVGQAGKAFQLAQEDANEWATAAEREMIRLQESASSQFKRALETMKIGLAEMGEPFLIIGTHVVKAISGIVQAFNSMPDWVKYLVAGAAAFMALVGPIVMLTGLFANFTGNMLKFGIGITGVLTRFELLNKESAAAKIAAGLAAEGFATERTQVQLLTEALGKLSLAEAAAAKAARNARLDDLVAGGMSKSDALAQLSRERRDLLVNTGQMQRTKAGGIMNLDAVEQDQAKIAKDSARTKENWKAAGGSMLLAGASLATMVGTSNETASNIANMVLYAALLGPAFAVIPWARMGSGIASMVKGSGGLVKGIGAAGKGAAGMVLSFAKFAGPAGLIAAAVGGLAIMYTKINDNAEAIEKMNNTASTWGEIFGYEALEAGAIIDPETGKKVSDVTSRVKELNEAAPEVGQAIRDVVDGIGKDFTEAEAHAEAMNIAIRQGLEVIKTGGSAKQARQAVEASLMAGLEDAQLVNQLMATVDLRVKFDVNESVLRESLAQVNNQIKTAFEDGVARTRSETLAATILGIGPSAEWGGVSEGSEEAARAAARDFWDTWAATSDEEQRNNLGNQMEAQFDRLRDAQVAALKANPEAVDALADAGFTNMDEFGADEWLQIDMETIKRLEAADVNVKGITESIVRAGRTEREFAKQLALSAGLSEETADGLWTVEEVMERIQVNYMSNEERQKMLTKAAREYAEAIRWAGAAAASAGVALTDEQRLQILNNKRVEIGLERTGNLLDGFGPATEKWNDGLSGSEKGVNRINNALASTKTLAAMISQQEIIDTTKNARAAFQEGIANATRDMYISQWESDLDTYENNQQARLDRFENQSQNAQDALEDRQERRRKRLEKSFDSRIESINKQIEAEKRAEDVRQRIYDAEMKRLDRMNARENFNIDFNMALNEGDLDEAARLRSNMQAETQGWTLEDAADDGSRASEKRTKRMEKQIDNIEKTRDARLEALDEIEERERKQLERSQERERKALQASVDNNIKAERDKFEARKEFLEKSLDEFTGVTYVTNKQLRKQIALWNRQHEGLSLTTEGRFNTSTKNIHDFMRSHIGEARKKIANDKQWEASGKQIAKRMIMGAFGLNLQQFKRWMITGKYPQVKSENTGWNSDDQRAVPHHTGGMIGRDKGSRKGVARTSSLHPNEQMVLAQKGEFMVNRDMASKHADVLESINNGTYSQSPAAPLSTRQSNQPLGGMGKGGLGMAGLMMGVFAATMKSAMGSAVQVGAAEGRAKQQRLEGGFGAGKAGEYGDVNFTKTQLRHAATIASVGREMGMSNRDIKIGIMTAITESMLSLPNQAQSDRDSAGLFQQRPSQGWGSVEEVMNPEYASREFFKALKGVRDRNDMSPWLAAQAVQRSYDETGSNYRKYWDEAQQIFRSGLVTEPGAPMGPGGTHKPIKLPVSRGLHDTDTAFPGIDIAAPVGTPVYAPTSGRVTASYDLRGDEPRARHGGLGYRSYGRVMVFDPDGPQQPILFAHLSKRNFNAGAQVTGGTVLGKTGDTGYSSGPHLHFGDADGNPYNWLSLRKGAANINKDGVKAELHKDEAVLTKDLNNKLKVGITQVTETPSILNQLLGALGNSPGYVNGQEIASDYAAASAATDGDVRTGTYNVSFGERNANTKEDLRRLMEQADVLSLSEMTRTKTQLLPWFEEMGWGVHGGNGDYVAWNKRIYTAVDKGMQRLNQNAVDAMGGKIRDAAYVRLQNKETGRDFWQIAAHTITSAHKGNRRETQLEQFNNLRKLQERLSASAPVILGGDLNQDPRRADTIKRIGMGAGRSTGAFTLGRSYLDHILSTGGLKMLGQQVFRGHSDHKGLLAQFDLPQMRTGGHTLSDGIAKLHAEETVLTKPLSADFKQGVQNFANGGNNTYNLNMQINGRDYNMQQLAREMIRIMRAEEDRAPQRRTAGAGSR